MTVESAEHKAKESARSYEDNIRPNIHLINAII